MSEELLHSEQNDEVQLSEEDRAVLDAFDALDTLSLSTTPFSSQPVDTENTEFSDTSMLCLFAAEMDEEIAHMKRALSQMESGDAPDSLNIKGFDALSRIAHKVRGTAGAMECHAMAAIAHHIEVVVQQIKGGTLLPLVGLNALVQAVLALEVTLQDLLANGSENDEPLTNLELELEQLVRSTMSLDVGTENTVVYSDMEEQERQDMQSLPLLPASIRIDAYRFKHLLGHTEHSIELRNPLENAQEQVKAALLELHQAQSRLQQLESSLLSLVMPIRPSRQGHSQPASSLVERTLKEADSLHGTPFAKKLKLRSQALKNSQATNWDELELERFTERDNVVRMLSTAIAEVTVATTRVQAACDHQYELTQRFMQQATLVHDHIHKLRLTPLRVLLPRIQSVVDKSALPLRFEIVGETTEIDQDILDALASPLLHFLRACLTDVMLTTEGSDERYHVWLHARALGNEVTLELGFSMPIQGGALTSAQSAIQQIGGSIELHRNSERGISFFIRLPRSQGSVRGLLVRVGKEQVVLPFSQVQRVGDVAHEKLDIVYRLYKLLNFPLDAQAKQSGMPVVVLPQGHSRLVAGIIVDEVIGDVEVVVKPLDKKIQRPGIAGTVLDGKGNLLLLLDIPELLKYYTAVRRHQVPDVDEKPRALKAQHLVLIADDSTLLRKSLAQTLTYAGYEISEASDGLEALDKLTQIPPDIFLLDMEMPNLNGYDLLNIMRIYPELMDVKVIMLTSRISEKHRQHAFALGAHAYLTKPCPQDVLLETIAGLL